MTRRALTQGLFGAALVATMLGCQIAPAPRDATLWDLLPGGYQGYASFEVARTRSLVDGLMADWFPNEDDRRAIMDRVDRVAVALPLLPGEERTAVRDRAPIAAVSGDLPALFVNAALGRGAEWSRARTEVGGQTFRYWEHATHPLQVAVVGSGHVIISQGGIHSTFAVLAGEAGSASLPTESRLRMEEAAGGLYLREPNLELPDWVPARQARLPISEMTVAASPIPAGQLWSLSGNVVVDGELNARIFTTLVRFLARRSRTEIELHRGSDGESPEEDAPEGGDSGSGTAQGGPSGDDASPDGATPTGDMLPSLSVERDGTVIAVRGFVIPQETLEENLLNALRLLGYS
ncbi:MAG: hypothetical protein ACOCYG_08890 [Spirochaetota bacterium]